MVERCQSCGRTSSMELIPVQRKIGAQFICFVCFKAEKDAEEQKGNWKDTQKPRRFNSTEIKY